MRFSYAVLFLLLAFVLTGMGSLGGVPEGQIPETKENVRARLVDRQGVATDLQNFSMDGKVLLSAARGSGMVTIPFKEVAFIEFGEAAGNLVNVRVAMIDGGIVPLKVEGRSVFYGSTQFGFFQIRARDVGRIEFSRDAVQ